MRLLYLLVSVSALAVTTGAWAGQAPQAAPAPQAPHSVQQDFDAATALAQGSDNAATLAAWEALEKRVSGNRRTQSIVLVRKSVALLALDREDEANTAAREGIAGLPVNDATLHDDRLKAYFVLGQIAEDSLDYASAADFYRQAEGIADAPAEKLNALLDLIGTETFTDPSAAAAAVTRIDALLATTETDKFVAAMVARREGLLLLNTGNVSGARKESMKAVELLGGLTSKTDSNDVSARSDVAIAALLLHDTDTARQYMAMTGAGRLDKGSFDPGIQMKAPECGGEAGLKPQDMAVVEFSIGDDGTVLGATPIYAAGGGAVALEFARAAKVWWWTPEQVRNLPKFFRYRARVEMRCSTAFERPSIRDMLDGSMDAWLSTQGVAVPDKSEASDAAQLPRQRAALTSAEAKDGGNGLDTLAALRPLLDNVVVPADEKKVLASRALAIADAKQAPALARLAIDRTMTVDDPGAKHRGDWSDVHYDALLAKPAYAGDPRARSAIRLLYADAESRSHKPQSRAMIEQVAADPALQANDPLRVGALVRLASLDQQTGDTEGARAAFDKSGLAANQCAIIDSPPKLLSAAGTFPMEAVRWGFEGWTQAQFDIDANGKVVNDRAILSYPPFIFTKAGVDTFADARYAKSYRPDGGLGCGAQTNRVRFVLPH